MSEPERIGEIISRRKAPARTGNVRKLDVLALNWGRVAGERISGHTAPTRLARGVLTVSAEGPAWASEAAALAATILQRATALLGGGAVRKVRVRARPQTQEEAVEEQRGEAARAAAAGLVLDEDIKGRLSKIPEEKTRSALEGLLRASRVTSKAGKLTRRQ